MHNNIIPTASRQIFYKDGKKVNLIYWTCSYDLYIHKVGK